MRIGEKGEHCCWTLTAAPLPGLRTVAHVADVGSKTCGCQLSVCHLVAVEFLGS